MNGTPSHRFQCKAIVLACAGAVAAIAAPAFAQSAQEAPRGTLLVEVTGSNLKRADGETSLPVQVITRQEMLDGGMQTVQDLLERISANQSLGGFNDALGTISIVGVNSNQFGFSAASLRGLGAARTLVLLNGRRLAPYGAALGQGVDIAAIPTSALARVEILKDGASAIYGSDAIGGVMNFILRDDFAGAELSGNYYGTEHGGGDNWRVNATVGKGDLTRDRYNVFLSADYFRQEPLANAAREATRSSYRPEIGVDFTGAASFPANIVQPGGFGTSAAAVRNPTIPYPGGAVPASCAPAYSYATPSFPYRCSFEPLAQGDAIPAAEKVNVVGRAAWQVDPATQLFAEGSWYRGTYTHTISSTPVNNSTMGGSVYLPVSSEFYPAAFVATLPKGDPMLPVEVRYRTIDLGPRTDQGTSEQWRAVAGLNGTWQGWDYALAANATANDQSVEFVSGWVQRAGLLALIRSGSVNPFAYNTGTALAQLQALQVAGKWYDSRAADYGGTFKVSRGFGGTAAGPIAVAFGVEGRREQFDMSFTDIAGAIVGANGLVPPDTGAGRNVWAAYAEANVPFTKTFEATAAVRYDHYSDFGGTFNPKISLRWQPVPEVVFRGSWGTGFRAPTLSDVYQPLYFYGYTLPFDDPLRCPVTQADTDCRENFAGKTGGTPTLQPETSTQWGVGAVWEPVPGLSLGADYYWVRVDNMIDTLLQREIFGDYARWAPEHVVRKPPTAQDVALGIPGPIDFVIENRINYGSLTTSGIDVDLRWRLPATMLGQWTVGFTGTYVIDYQRDLNDSEIFPSGPGQRSPLIFGAISRWRHYATLGWTYGPWGATLAQTYQDGYSEPCVPLDATDCLRRVGSYSTWDVQGRYTGFTNMTLTLGIRNLADVAPPVSNQFQTAQVGYDPSYADPRGRTFYGAIRYAFR